MLHVFVLPSKLEENQLKYVQVIAIFLSVVKEEEKYKETKINFKDAYISFGLADSAQI